MFPLFLDAAWKVAISALILGAGLPALFAVGVRSLVLAGAEAGAAVRIDDGAAQSEARGTGSPVVLRVLGIVCIALVLLAVAVGLTVIIASGFGKAVSFDSVIPMIVDKK